VPERRKGGISGAANELERVSVMGVAARFGWRGRGLSDPSARGEKRRRSSGGGECSRGGRPGCVGERGKGEGAVQSAQVDQMAAPAGRADGAAVDVGSLVAGFLRRRLAL